MMKKVIKYLVVSGSFLVGVLLLLSAGQFPEWPVPANEAAVGNPVPFSPKAISNGRALFEVQCKSCHGPKALGDGVIPSANLMSDEAQAQSDGAIHWKLIKGRGQMPSFANLPAEQLWEVIHYLRSLAKPAEVIVKKKTLVELELMDNDSVKKVIARAFEITDNGVRIPLVDIKLDLGVKRMFGVLPLNESVTYSDNEGKVSGMFPADLPSDTAGFVVITASVDDPGYEPGTVEKKVRWGKSWTYTDITKQRSLWARVQYAPVWLIISFTSVAGAIWITIIWVMLELKKINDKGRKLKVLGARE